MPSRPGVEFTSSTSGPRRERIMSTPAMPSPRALAERTAVLEAVIAHSDRPNFGKGLVALPVIRPLMRHAAARLWRDDLAYAERLYTLRSEG